MALLEAMSAQLPIVATDVGGMPDALGGGSAGRIVPSENPEALAAALLAVLRDPSEAKRLSDAALSNFHARFTAGAMATAYEALYGDGVGS